MTAVKCPDGYRPVRESDIAVGMSVVYVSRGDGNWIHTRVEDAKIIEEDQDRGPCVRLEAKHVAALSRIFVPTTAAVGAECSDSDMHDTKMFLKTAVAPWVESMAKNAQEKEVTLPEVLEEMFTSFCNIQMRLCFCRPRG